MDSHSVSSCHTSSSSLYSDVDTLRSKLDEKDTLLQTAAQYGKDLLDHNRELANSLDETTRKYTRQIEVLKESNYSLTQRLEQKSRMEEEYQEEIESLKKHLNSQREELKVLQELTDQSSLISDLRQRLRDVEASVDKLELENRQLKTHTMSYKDQVEEANIKIKQLQDSFQDTASDEMSALLRELNEATSLRNELSRDCSMKDQELLSLTQQVESHTQRIDSLHEELNEANSQLSGLSNSFMAATQENQELRCEIDMLRMSDRDHKKKGNSMFSELDDKRQEAEKKLLLLNVQHEGLVNQYDLSKKQMTKLKLQMSNILRLVSGQVDNNHVDELESQLNEARNEIQSLSTKVAKLTADGGPCVQQAIRDTTGCGDHKTVQFVENLLKTKDEELRRVQKELEEKRLAVTYGGQQLNETQHKLRTMEGKANQLHAHNIQLSVKLEELKTKYEESPNPETHLERGRVEDIPDYNPEIAQALLGSEAKSTDSVRSDNAAAVEDRLSIHEETLADNQSLSEIQNHEMQPMLRQRNSTSARPTTPTTPTTKYASSPSKRSTPGRYFSENRSPLSSTDSLWDGGQVNAKSYDNSCKQAEKKVINVSSKDQDPNNCATQ